MTEFVNVALESMVGNVLSAPVIALLALRRAFRLAVGRILIDAHDLKDIYHEHGQSGPLLWVPSQMANRLADQLQEATKDLRGHLGLVAYLSKSRHLTKMCATAAWGIMLSQRPQADKAAVVVDCMELLNAALGSWHVNATRRAIERFRTLASGWVSDPGDQNGLGRGSQASAETANPGAGAGWLSRNASWLR